MDAHRYRSSFNGIPFNQVYDDTGITDEDAHLVDAFRQSDYRLESVDLTRLTVEDFREMRQFLEGAEANESFEGVLFATMRGVIHGTSRADLEDKTWAMRAAFSPAIVRQAAVAADPAGVLPWDFKVTTGAGISARRLYAKPAIGRPILVGRMREGLSRRFLAQLVSMDPCVHDQALTQTSMSGTTDITNNGNFYARPKIVINVGGSGAVNFTITNNTTGKALVLDLSGMAATDDFTIDVRRGTITRDSDGANLYSRRVSGYVSDMILLPGVNNVARSNITNVNSIRFDFRDAWA